VYLTPRWGSSLWNFLTRVWLNRNRILGLYHVRKSLTVLCICLDTIPQRDGQTDRQTEMHNRHRVSYWRDAPTWNNYCPPTDRHLSSPRAARSVCLSCHPIKKLWVATCQRHAQSVNAFVNETAAAAAAAAESAAVDGCRLSPRRNAGRPKRSGGQVWYRQSNAKGPVRGERYAGRIQFSGYIILAYILCILCRARLFAQSATFYRSLTKKDLARSITL